MPTNEDAIRHLLQKYPYLPASYIEFLEQCNGVEGDLGVQPGWFVVWSAEDALVFSDEYEIPIYLPGYFAFGSNGGGELFVIELQPHRDDRQVFMVPAIGMSQTELHLVTESFAEFQSQMGKALEE